MFKKSVMAALAGVALLGATPVLAQGIGHTSLHVRGSGRRRATANGQAVVCNRKERWR
ncbi:hypothetical protein ACRAWD_20540 [Caulobacter segnis]